MKNPYDVLGIPNYSTELEIKSAFRRLAKETHPDMNGGNPQSATKFHEISDAYSLLINSESRSQVDNSLRKHGAEFNLHTKYESENTRNNYFDEQFAEQYIRNLVEGVSEYKKTASKAIWIGLAWLFGGIFVSYMSYSSSMNSGSDSYFVTSGAILFGAIQAIRGFISYSKITTAINEYEKELWAKYDEIFKANKKTVFYEEQQHNSYENKDSDGNNQDFNQKKRDNSDKEDNDVKSSNSDDQKGDVVSMLIFISIFVFVIAAIVSSYNNSQTSNANSSNNLESETIEYSEYKISISSTEKELLIDSIDIDQAIRYTSGTYRNAELNQLAYIFKSMGYDIQGFNSSRVKDLIVFISHYQKEKGLEVDGMAGPNTMGSVAIDIANEKVEDDIRYIIQNDNTIVMEYGWFARKADNFTYFVSYDIDDDDNWENGWYLIPYEVNLYKQTVAEVNGVLEEKYRNLGFMN